MRYLSIFCILLFSACTVKIGTDNKIEATPGGVNITVAGSDEPPAALWCKYIPPQYKKYFSECSSSSPTSNLVKPIVTALYSSAQNWNDYIKSDGSAVCAGTETTYNACLNGGELRLAITLETNCSGLTLSDSEGVFNWTCSLVSGVAVFKSTMKTTKGLQDLISGTNFIPMYVTLTKGDKTVDSDTTTWWSNAISTLPNNSSTSAAVATLSTSGTIYVTSSDVQTSGYNITADKVSIVTLSGSIVLHNAKTGTNAHLDGSVGNDARTVLATGGHKYLWIEGNYDMNGPDTGGSWTIFLSNTILSKMKLVHAMRGYPIYLYQCNYNTLESVTVTDSIDFGMQVDTSNGNGIINFVSENNSHYGMGVGNSNNNYVYNFKSNNSFGGLRLFSGSGGNIFDEMLFTNLSDGIYIPGTTTTNYISNVTISNITTNALSIQSSDNQYFSNILIDTTNYGISWAIAHNNIFSELKIKNCTYGLYSYDGAGTEIDGEVWYDSNTNNCAIIYGGSAGFNSSCVASGPSTFTVVTSSSNVFGYQL